MLRYWFIFMKMSEQCFVIVSPVQTKNDDQKYDDDSNDAPWQDETKQESGVPGFITQSSVAVVTGSAHHILVHQTRVATWVGA